MSPDEKPKLGIALKLYLLLVVALIALGALAGINYVLHPDEWKKAEALRIEREKNAAVREKQQAKAEAANVAKERANAIQQERQAAAMVVAAQKKLEKKYGGKYYGTVDDFDVYAVKVQHDEYDTRALTGIAVNTSNRRKSYTQIVAEITDPSGAVIETPFDAIAGLDSGQSWRFKIPILSDGSVNYRIKGIATR